MAKSKGTPGRVRQLLSVYKLTIKKDKASLAWALLALALGVGFGISLAAFFGGDNVFSNTLFIISGSITGILAALIVMSRRAEQVAYSQIEGQPGAVGAVLSSSLRKNYTSSEMPVAVNPKTHDAVYRTVGQAGIVLIGEAPTSTRIKSLVEDEKKKIARIAPGVPVHTIFATGDGVELHRLTKEIYKLKKQLNRAEVAVVRKRLDAIGSSLPIPKGIDPKKFRAPRR